MVMATTKAELRGMNAPSGTDPLSLLLLTLRYVRLGKAQSGSVPVIRLSPKLRYWSVSTFVSMLSKVPALRISAFTSRGKHHPSSVFSVKIAGIWSRRDAPTVPVLLQLSCMMVLSKFVWNVAADGGLVRIEVASLRPACNQPYTR